MVKVRTGRGLRACISAVIRVESMPPDSSAPSGTSATRCASTASPSTCSSASTAWASLPVNGWAMPASATCASDQ